MRSSLKINQVLLFTEALRIDHAIISDHMTLGFERFRMRICFKLEKKVKHMFRIEKIVFTLVVAMNSISFGQDQASDYLIAQNLYEVSCASMGAPGDILVDCQNAGADFLRMNQLPHFNILWKIDGSGVSRSYLIEITVA